MFISVHRGWLWSMGHRWSLLWEQRPWRELRPLPGRLTSSLPWPWKSSRGPPKPLIVVRTKNKGCVNKWLMCWMRADLFTHCFSVLQTETVNTATLSDFSDITWLGRQNIFVYQSLTYSHSNFLSNAMKLRWQFFLLLFLYFWLGQWTDKKQSGRERGTGLGKLGLELGSPEAQRHYMSARCPRGYWHRQPNNFNDKLISLQIFMNCDPIRDRRKWPCASVPCWTLITTRLKLQVNAALFICFVKANIQPFGGNLSWFFFHNCREPSVLRQSSRCLHYALLSTGNIESPFWVTLNKL